MTTTEPQDAPTRSPATTKESLILFRTAALALVSELCDYEFVKSPMCIETTLFTSPSVDRHGIHLKLYIVDGEVSLSFICNGIIPHGVMERVLNCIDPIADTSVSQDIDSAFVLRLGPKR